MTRCNLTPKQMDEVLEVLNNARETVFGSGVVRVKGLSKATVKFLVRDGWLKKGEDGKYRPDRALGLAGGHKYFSLYWTWLPVDLLWHVVEPMLGEDGKAGYPTITAGNRWGLLNIFRRGEGGFEGKWGEIEQYEVLSALAAHGYVWFLSGGSVWEVTRRKDEVAA